MQIPEMEQEIDKMSFVFGIVAFQSGAANSHNSKQETVHRQSRW